ncbi:Chloroperoxidase [Panaeolus papilionaceus]|nr:Chloroperoxidase [Panaeolus papilionaceus]
MSAELPASHPAVHQHAGEKCPVTGQDAHGYCPPQQDDIRSPCPALNTMANHGYISRDGKNLSASMVKNGLKECYGLSSPLAAFLTYVGFLMIRKFGKITLHDIAKHGQIEHDASLVHADTPEGEIYAPNKIYPELLDKFLTQDVKPNRAEVEASAGGADITKKWVVNFEDVARARIRREKECRPIDAVHQEIARGEMAIILGVWETTAEGGGKVGAPGEWIRRWLGEERLPEGWKPTHVQGFFDVVKRAKSIKLAAEEYRKKEAAQQKEK